MSACLHDVVERLEQRVARLEGVAERAMPPAIRRVVRQVAAHFGFTEVQLLGEERAAPVALARHMAMSLVRELHGHSLPRIGRAFDRDHTSVMHAVRRIAALRRTSPEVASQWDALAETLSQPPVKEA